MGLARWNGETAGGLILPSAAPLQLAGAESGLKPSHLLMALHTTGSFMPAPSLQPPRLPKRHTRTKSCHLTEQEVRKDIWELQCGCQRRIPGHPFNNLKDKQAVVP